jgi:hypothetical protein
MAAQPAELTSEPEASEAPIAEFAQEAGAVVMQQGEAPPLDLRTDDFANERLDAPELFETFLPAVADLPVAVAADALPALDTVAEVEEIPQVEDILQVAGPAAPAIATPEEIEAYGRFEAPVASASAKPVSSFAVEESFSIECIIDPEPAHEEPAVSMPPPVEAASGPVAASDEEEIDLSWAVDNLQFETAPAEALQKPEKTADVEASEFESTELALTQGEAEETASTDEAAEEPPAKRPPVYLGPLATWARLERKTDEERRPGSDMREIIERLAVPPHIAGVSYARGVRIRRVRVAGARDRRRPADQSGPVILSRRALAETRSVAP